MCYKHASHGGGESVTVNGEFAGGDVDAIAA